MTYTRNITRQLITILAVSVVMIACMMVLSCRDVWADGPEDTPADPAPAAAEEVSAPAPSSAPAATDVPVAASETPGPEPAPAAPVSEQAVSTEAATAETASSSPSVPEESAPATDSQETIPAEAQTADAAQESAVQESGSVQNNSVSEAAAEDEKQDGPVLTMTPQTETVRSDAKTAGEDSDADADTGSDAVPNNDISNKTVENLRYDKSTGILSWNPVEGAVNYYATVNYKNESHMGSAFGVTVPETSINIYDKDIFADLLEFIGTAEYTFRVQGRADYEGADGTTIQNRTGFTSLPVTFTPDMALAHHFLKINVLTSDFSYIKADNRFEESSRARVYSQGGEVLINGKSVNTVTENGETDYLSLVDIELRAGDKVTVSYRPADGYELKFMKIDGQEVSGSQTITIRDKDIEILVEFRLPIAAIFSNELEITSDNFEEAAQNILMSDMSRVTRWVTGYVQLRVNTVRDVTMPDSSRNICDIDPYLKSSNIKKGIFFNAFFYKSLKLERPAPEAKTSKPVNIRITIPDYLKSTNSNVMRTFYLIKVHDGDASMLADSTGDTLSGYITESGLYLIGFKDTDLTGIMSSASGNTYSYASYEEPEPVIVPALIDLPDPNPVISAVEVFPEETSVPASAAAVAAGAAAVVGGAFALRRLLPVLASGGAE